MFQVAAQRIVQTVDTIGIRGMLGHAISTDSVVDAHEIGTIASDHQ